MPIKERSNPTWWGWKRMSSPKYGNPAGINYSRPTGYARMSSVSHPGPPYREGGPFLKQETSVTYKHQRLSGKAIFDYTFDVDLIPNGIVVGSLPPAIPNTTMVAKGTKGWSMFAPGQSQADLGVFIGELKDFPGMVKHARSWVDPLQKLAALKSAAKTARSAGNEYLAVEFGWKPMLSDLIKMADVVERTTKALKQLRRDNGQPVHRKGTIEVTSNVETNTTMENGAIWPSDYNSYFLASPMGYSQKRTSITSTIQKWWFAGSFKYFVPDFDAPETQIRLWSKMLGLNPSPKLVWELTPWSWLVDYFSSVGDIMSNVSASAAENLVATYAFCMGTTKVETFVNVTAPCKPGFKSVNCGATILQEVKQREAASPYGFGIDTSGLSPKQVAILGALGLSRA